MLRIIDKYQIDKVIMKKWPDLLVILPIVNPETPRSLDIGSIKNQEELILEQADDDDDNDDKPANLRKKSVQSVTKNIVVCFSIDKLSKELTTTYHYNLWQNKSRSIRFL